jgi:hypothetical protein
MALIGFGQKISPKKLTPLYRPKNGQNWPKWLQKDVKDIKNFCFLHHTSPNSYLKHGPNHFLAKKLAQKKLTPLYRPKNCQNWPKQDKTAQKSCY